MEKYNYIPLLDVINKGMGAKVTKSFKSTSKGLVVEYKVISEDIPEGYLLGLIEENIPFGYSKEENTLVYLIPIYAVFPKIQVNSITKIETKDDSTLEYPEKTEYFSNKSIKDIIEYYRHSTPKCGNTFCIFKDIEGMILI